MQLQRLITAISKYKPETSLTALFSTNKKGITICVEGRIYRFLWESVISNTSLKFSKHPDRILKKGKFFFKRIVLHRYLHMILDMIHTFV